MVEFLNKFNKKNRNAESQFIEEAEELFKKTITTIKGSIGKSAFRPTGIINVSVFEAVGDSLGHAGDTNGHAIHDVLLHALSQSSAGETHDA